MLTRDKALWNEAARTDSYSLTLDEFLSFRHPGKVTKFFWFLLNLTLRHTVLCENEGSEIFESQIKKTTKNRIKNTKLLQ